MQERIYKVCPREMWETARKSNEFVGSPDDIADGFIHFSSRDQLSGTLVKHFSGQSELVLLEVDTTTLGDALKWEPSRGGDLFPHLYGVMPASAVLRVDELPLDEEGTHILPRDLNAEES